MVRSDSARPGVVRLLEKEPTAAERYAHASVLMALINKPSSPTATVTSRRTTECVRA